MQPPQKAQSAEIQRRKEWLVNYLRGVMPPDDALLLKLIANISPQTHEGLPPAVR